MKLKNIYLLILLSFGFVIQAQVSFRPGVRAGLNLSKFTDTHNDFKSDFFVGIVEEIKLKKHYSLQPEITYSRQGARNVTFDNSSYYGNEASQMEFGTINVNYLSVGIINKLIFVKGFHALIGPSFDFLVENNLIAVNQDFDVSINAGLGISTDSGLTIDCRVKKGFGDVLDSSHYGYNDFINLPNSNLVVQFGATYTFDLKNKK